MKASEAKAKSTAIADCIAKKNAEKAKKAHLTQITNEKKRRRDFIKDFNGGIDEAIQYAIKQGKNSTRVYVSSGDTPVDSNQAFNTHEYLDIIKKSIARLKKDGYKVTTGQESYEHWTQHESSVPDYAYYTYSNYVDISWE